MPDTIWHSAWFSPHSDGMGGSYQYCDCTDGRHRWEHVLGPEKLNDLATKVKNWAPILEALRGVDIDDTVGRIKVYPPDHGPLPARYLVDYLRDIGVHPDA